MALIDLQGVGIGFGDPALLQDVSFQIESGERIGLIGRNGTGKTTLLKLLHGAIEPDSGVITRRKGTRTSLLTQDIPANLHGTVAAVISGNAFPGEDLSMDGGTRRPRYENSVGHLCQDLSADRSEDGSARRDQIAARLTSQMDLIPGQFFSDLSAGMKRRVLLARALSTEPDLLLLDEPTNHLDIRAIDWMEQFLNRRNQAFCFVTHDRIFLQELAGRIIEIDRGRLTSWTCPYSVYLERRQAMLQAEETKQGVFDKKLADEEEWIRRGIKARRTRNEGRVRRLYKMREALRARRDAPGRVQMNIQEADQSGRVVIEAKDVNYSREGKTILRDFSVTLLRGGRVGIIGPNGSGKTTLLNVLLKQLPPQSGTVRHGSRLAVAYFDQLRGQLDEDRTVIENIGEGNDRITIDGKTRHVISYMKDFLFTPERSRSPVRCLSGGERNRLLLAKLFTRPANVLVLDEPTNDLDTETLELQEERLHDYAGTILLVSHDRAFLNNVVTSTLAFEETGRVREYIGGYDDWIRQRTWDPATDETIKSATAKKQKPPARTRKLGFNEKRELDSIPEAIEAMEAEQTRIYEQMADPGFYLRHGDEIASTTARLEAIEKQLATLYERWEVLEAISTGNRSAGKSAT